MNDNDNYDPVVNLMSGAASRPALIRHIGVDLPTVICIVGAGGFFSIMLNLFFVVGVTIVILIIAKYMTRMDPYIFRTIGLCLMTRSKNITLNPRTWTISSFTRSSYTCNKSRF